MRMTLGRGLDGSNTSYSSISSAVSDKSESLSMENWWMGGRRSYLSGNTERSNRHIMLLHEVDIGLTLKILDAYIANMYMNLHSYKFSMKKLS